MADYELIMRIETDEEDGISADDVRDAVYQAGGDWPFSFEIISVEGFCGGQGDGD